MLLLGLVLLEVLLLLLLLDAVPLLRPELVEVLVPGGLLPLQLHPV